MENQDEFEQISTSSHFDRNQDKSFDGESSISFVSKSSASTEGLESLVPLVNKL